MKKIFAILLMLSMVFTSCDDAYNIAPDDEILESNAITSVADLEKAILGVYATISGSNIVSYSSRFTDDLRLPADNRGQGVQVHTWNIIPDNGAVTGIWSNMYAVINRANRLLDVIDGVPANTDDEIATKERIKAECYAARALSHFDLLRFYGQSYTDGTKLGVPNVDYVVVFDQLSRNTVAENYTLIEQDLQTAADMLDVSFTDNTRFTLNAINALRARVALYKGDYAKAIEYSTSVIDSAPLATAAEYADIWTDASEAEVVFKLKRTNNDGFIGTLYQDTNGDIFFYMSDDLLGEFLGTSVNDPRFAVNLDLPNSTSAEPVIGKYLGTEANPGLNDVKVFRSSEMYLIRAEAYANQDKLISAAADMDLLRTARASFATPAYTTKQEAIDDIMSERRIELAFEGHRFFDLKRSNSGFDRSANDCAAASGACSITSSDHRWVLPIPQQEIFANDNIQQNPNYDSN